MSAPTVAVTGAAGFIGRWVVDELRDRGYTVRGLDDLSNGSRRNVAAFDGDAPAREPGDRAPGQQAALAAADQHAVPARKLEPEPLEAHVRDIVERDHGLGEHRELDHGLINGHTWFSSLNYNRGRTLRKISSRRDRTDSLKRIVRRLWARVMPMYSRSVER